MSDIDFDDEEYELVYDDEGDEGDIVDLGDGVSMETDPETGDKIVDFNGGGAFAGEGPDLDTSHSANLAEHLTESELSGIASEIVEWIKLDEESRSDWITRMRDGMRDMGVAEETKTNEPFPGASRVTHPVLAEAVVQFQARAIKELFPPKGPVKANVVGLQNPGVNDARARVEDYMNYQYTVQMPEAFWEMDTLLFYLPISGSAFKKTYFDTSLGRNTTAFVTAEELIVPYSASNLMTAPRYTHKIAKQSNDLKKLMRNGQYSKIDLTTRPQVESDDLDDEIDRAEGRSDPMVESDDVYTLYECHLDYDLVGFEDIDEEGEPTDIGLPYVITIEKESERVLSIRRNWAEDDEGRRKRIWFQHFKYLPGLGFYGYGLLHMIGGLSKAATGSLRSLLDAAQFSNLQGGFRSRDARVPGGENQITPGHWIEVDATGDDLAKGFYKPPYGEPSGVMYQLLGLLVETAQRFATTADAMVGDGDNKGPVGTTLALIEQGSKIFSSIHKRLHRACGEEFRLMAELNQEHLDGQEEYNVAGASRFIKPGDFDMVGVIPVSDPNIFSATQRIAQAQAGLQLAKEAPHMHNEYEAYKRMYQALEIGEYETVLIDPSAIVRMDPIQEAMAMLHGKPVNAVIDQNHKAHLAVHEHWFKTLPPPAQKKLEGLYMAHVGEHLAYQYRLTVMQTMGIELPPPPKMSGRGPVRHENGSEVPPEVENQIAEMAAMAILKLPATALPKPPPENPDVIKAKGEVQRKAMLSKADIQRKDAESKSGADREDQEAQREIARQDAGSVRDSDRKDREAQADILRKNAQANIDAAATDTKNANDLHWNARKAKQAEDIERQKPRPPVRAKPKPKK